MMNCVKYHLSKPRHQHHPYSTESSLVSYPARRPTTSSQYRRINQFPHHIKPHSHQHTKCPEDWSHNIQPSFYSTFSLSSVDSSISEDEEEYEFFIPTSPHSQKTMDLETLIFDHPSVTIKLHLSPYKKSP
ncbi:hypothetical protein CLU79DRAFT_883763 [Phycomyces nitens]|nr:hypothetical protein CLU79DRAFT_883763 [Phycomyces nitens]